jgi:peptidoglycan lytic transglycosylase
MKRALPLFVPSLTGCVLGASLVFGCPDVDGAQAGRAADGSPRATAGTQPLSPARVQIGLASWYGRRWQGRPTASGERYDRHQPTAAHRTAPLGTQAVVTNLANGHTVRVRINDRGPHTRHRILDLSYEAARQLDMVRTGAARVKVEFLAASPPPFA